MVQHSKLWQNNYGPLGLEMSSLCPSCTEPNAEDSEKQDARTSTGQMGTCMHACKGHSTGWTGSDWIVWGAGVGKELRVLTWQLV